MILHLEHFIQQERPYWDELEKLLETLEKRAEYRPSLDAARRLYYLYRRVASDLAQVRASALDVSLEQYLEQLVAKTYSEIHETRDKAHRLRPIAWFTQSFPQTYRKHSRAFWMSLGITMLGVVFGAFIEYADPNVKEALIPFPHLMTDPSDRVAEEESREEDRMEGHQSQFAAQLMVNNIRVSILAMALGMTFGLGTVILLFYNGAIIGIVALDYIRAGETVFLTGWLLPHGSVEIPAILFGGQAGLILAQALMGWGESTTLHSRMRKVGPDLMYLIYGVAVLLVWAGIVESFFSQYHEPVLPYEIKIIFGATQLVVLFLFLKFSGREKAPSKEQPAREASHALD